MMQLASIAILALTLGGPKPASAPVHPDFTLTLGEQAPEIIAQLHSSRGALLVGVDVRPEVRSLSLRFSTMELPPGRQLVAVEVYDAPPAPNSRPKMRGVLRQVPENELDVLGGRVLKASFPLQPRSEAFTWFIQLRSEAQPDGTVRPLAVDLRVESDSRSISARERELMRWRDRVDPEKDPEAVRSLFSRLTDEEVRLYTNFRDRATFLKHWKRTRLRDLRDGQGGVVFTPETRPLREMGTPLPDGRYLHHNGKPLLD